ncbi:MAG: adenosylcobinamide-GDP ribazoletransferase [Chitinophagales bacterium]|nr:adenosylcobinamide-GDP ribazoletransferase [Chitinophagales bacterium]
MKEQIQIFFTALMFYTRIPCPNKLEYSQDNINKATRYFPLIGWIIGGLSFIVYYLSSIFFDTDISIIFSLMAGVLLTGAFHEDGLADTLDGFGGGWTQGKILDIMKDSRIGTYGTIGLIFLFLLKYKTLSLIANEVENHSHISLLALIFIAYHSLARLTAIQIVFTSKYSRNDESSKSKPIAKGHSYKEKMGAYLFGGIPILLLGFFHWEYFWVFLPLSILYYTAKKYFEKWIDGYTGDCLGAVEQIAECVILLFIIALWRFI